MLNSEKSYMVYDYCNVKEAINRLNLSKTIKDKILRLDAKKLLKH